MGQEKRELEKAETSKVHSFELLLASLTGQQETETEDWVVFLSSGASFLFGPGRFSSCDTRTRSSKWG